jgi:steroid delta-isomerase-like uncharacterized protein
MKKDTTIAAFCLIAALTACGLTARAQSTSSSSALARAWLEDLNRHDTLALAGLYTDSARIFSPNWEGAKVGPAGVRETYRRYFSGTPDLRHDLIRVLATDTVLVIEYFYRGSFDNPEAGTPAYMKGKKYELRCCTRLDLRAGKIYRQESYFDQVAFLRQVGFFDHLGN